MASPAGPAETRAFIVERLIGETGEPEPLLQAARGLAAKIAPALAEQFLETLGLAVLIEVGDAAISRLAEARPEGQGAAMTIAAASPADAAVLSLDGTAAATLVQMLFGGDPATRAEPIERALSATEKEVIGLAFDCVAGAVEAGSGGAIALALRETSVLAGADLEKIALRDGPAVTLCLVLVTQAGRGELRIVLPQRMLKQARSGPATKQGDDWHSRFSGELLRSSVSLQATVPLTMMTLGDLSRLTAGQVIEFDETAPQRTRLSARQKTLFICEFGKIGQNYTVRINHPFDEGQDLMDGLLPV